jgi:ankyrin repeat protein
MKAKMTAETINQALQSAVRQADLAACLRALDAGADPNIAFGDLLFTNGGEKAVYVSSLLELAIVTSFSEGAALLLSRGAALTPTDLDATAPLMAAASVGDFEICVDLLERGALVNATTRDGTSALHKAAQAMRSRICELLIRSGANVHAWQASHGTALHVAAQSADPRAVEVIEVLIAGGADPGYMRSGAQDDDVLNDTSAFHLAVRLGRARTVQCFLALGQDPAQTTPSGVKMSDLAHPRAAEIIRAALTEQAVNSKAYLDSESTTPAALKPSSPSPL